MPASIQNRTTSIIASCTAGFSKLRSGWWPKNRCQKNCRRTGSKVQFDVSVSTKMMRASAYFSSVSRPHVEVAVRAVGVRARGLEPRVRVGGVVHDQVGDDPDPAGVRGRHQLAELRHGAELREHGVVVADVVPAVAQRRGVERRQPEAVDAEPLDVVELVDEAGEVARAGARRVGEGPDEDLVEDGLLVPVGVVVQPGAGQLKSLHAESPGGGASWVRWSRSGGSVRADGEHVRRGVVRVEADVVARRPSPTCARRAGRAPRTGCAPAGRASWCRRARSSRGPRAGRG